MAHDVSLANAFRTWGRIALLSFGGPAGQIAVMHRMLVEEKRWLSERRFLHALNYCMLLPGPEAQQLATYIGWLMHGTRGGLLAGGLFILPGVLSIMALSMLYAAYGHLGLVAGLFFGLKTAVLTIVLQAVIRVGRRALKSPILKAIAGTAFGAVFFFDIPFPIIIVVAGLIGLLGAGHPAFVGGGAHGRDAGALSDDDYLLGDMRPGDAIPALSRTIATAATWLLIWLSPVVLLVAFQGESVFAAIASFFSQVAVLTFGGAYAVLAYIAQQAVEHFHWLRPGEMLDGLGMAETTPGPLIMVLQFVGFLAAYRAPGGLPPMLAGIAGGLLATWVTFTPCFLWVFVGAPYHERFRGWTALAGALTAITAAVVGVILNLAIWFSLHTLFHESVAVRGFGLHFDRPVLTTLDPWALALSLAAAGAVFYLRMGMLAVLAGSAVAGAAIVLVMRP